MDATPPLPPRHFWRRFAAFIVDYALVSALVTLMLLPFHDPDTNRLRLSGLLNTSNCSNVTSLTQELVDLVAPSQVDAAIHCTHTANFIDNGRTVKIQYDTKRRQEGIMNYQSHKTLSVAIDGNDNIVKPLHPQGFMELVILIVASAGLLARGLMTPGKRLLGLNVTGDGCPWLRELRRFAPALAVAFTSLALSLGGADTLLSPLTIGYGPYVAIGFALIAFFVFYYLWPLMRWRGAMRYDRATGFVVTRR